MVLSSFFIIFPIFLIFPTSVSVVSSPRKSLQQDDSTAFLPTKHENEIEQEKDDVPKNVSSLPGGFALSTTKDSYERDFELRSGSKQDGSKQEHSGDIELYSILTSDFLESSEPSGLEDYLLNKKYIVDISESDLFAQYCSNVKLSSDDQGINQSAYFGIPDDKTGQQFICKKVLKVSEKNLKGIREIGIQAYLSPPAQSMVGEDVLNDNDGDDVDDKVVLGHKNVFGYERAFRVKRDNSNRSSSTRTAPSSVSPEEEEKEEETVCGKQKNGVSDESDVLYYMLVMKKLSRSFSLPMDRAGEDLLKPFRYRKDDKWQLPIIVEHNELMTHEPDQHLLRHDSSVTEHFDFIRTYFRELLEGIRYMSIRGIKHGDLHPGNVMYQERKGHVIYEEPIRGKVETSGVASLFPEILEGSEHQFEKRGFIPDVVKIMDFDRSEIIPKTDNPRLGGKVFEKPWKFQNFFKDTLFRDLLLSFNPSDCISRLRENFSLYCTPKKDLLKELIFPENYINNYLAQHRENVHDDKNIPDPLLGIEHSRKYIFHDLHFLLLFALVSAETRPPQYVHYDKNPENTPENTPEDLDTVVFTSSFSSISEIQRQIGFLREKWFQKQIEENRSMISDHIIDEKLHKLFPTLKEHLIKSIVERVETAARLPSAEVVFEALHFYFIWQNDMPNWSLDGLLSHPFLKR